MSPRPRASSSSSSTAIEVTAKPARRKHRALTQAQMVERLLKLLGKTPPAASRSSVRLAMGPRGQLMPEVLAHGDDSPEVLEKLSANAQAVFDDLLVKYAGRVPAENDGKGEG